MNNKTRFFFKVMGVSVCFLMISLLLCVDVTYSEDVSSDTQSKDDINNPEIIDIDIDETVFRVGGGLYTSDIRPRLEGKYKITSIRGTRGWNNTYDRYSIKGDLTPPGFNVEDKSIEALRKVAEYWLLNEGWLFGTQDGVVELRYDDSSSRIASDRLEVVRMWYRNFVGGFPVLNSGTQFIFKDGVLIRISILPTNISAETVEAVNAANEKGLTENNAAYIISEYIKNKPDYDSDVDDLPGFKSFERILVKRKYATRKPPYVIWEVYFGSFIYLIDAANGEVYEVRQGWIDG
ncbi:MAG: hypothetical protein KAR06_05890 [Deltaproteobacteria bacterium]|nr:hypothetical protein [Deltaproteobacteria bacterium]